MNDHQPPKTEIELKLEQKAAAMLAEKEAHRQGIQNTLIVEPPTLDKVSTWVPTIGPAKQAIMEPAGPSDKADDRYVTFSDYKLCNAMLTSEAPNAHSVPNMDFIKVVDLLRHAVGLLEAIGSTKTMNGTVSQRLDHVRETASSTAKQIKQQLGVE